MDGFNSFFTGAMFGPRVITSTEMVKTITKPVAYKLTIWQKLFMYMTPFHPIWPVTPIRWQSETVPSDQIMHDSANNVIYCHPAIERELRQSIESMYK